MWRPALMMAAVVLLDEPVWGLLAGKRPPTSSSSSGARVPRHRGCQRRRRGVVPRRPRSAASLVKRYLICEIECRYDRHRHLPRADRLADRDAACKEYFDPGRRARSGRARRSRPHRAGPAEPQPETLARIGESLDSEFVSLGHSGPQHLRIVEARTTAPSTSRPPGAAVALLCASLLNRGRTTLRNLARIEEVNPDPRGAALPGRRTRWIPGSSDLEVIPPTQARPRRASTSRRPADRTVIMFLEPLLHDHPSFRLPYAGGCDLGHCRRAPAPRCATSVSTSSPPVLRRPPTPPVGRPGPSCSPNAATRSPPRTSAAAR